MGVGGGVGGGVGAGGGGFFFGVCNVKGQAGAQTSRDAGEREKKTTERSAKTVPQGPKGLFGQHGTNCSDERLRRRGPKNKSPES